MGIFTSFYDNPGQHGDIVLSSRVRLARNIDSVPYPVRLNTIQKNAISNKTGEVLQKHEDVFSRTDTSNLYPFEAVALAERHLITPGFTVGTENKTAFINKDENLTVMMNDSDHIRIQAIRPGLNPENCLDAAMKTDDLLDTAFRFAFDSRLGYLNQSPVNIGTGMRASVQMHLPALTMKGEMGRISSLVTKLGINVRGSYGEGAAIKGDIYRFSNSICLGLSEKDAIANLKAIVMQIETKERTAAEELISDINVKDRILRAYALAKHAMLLGQDEMLEILSLVRMGAVYGICEVEPSVVSELFVYMQNACLSTIAGMKLSPEACNELRAKMISKIFAGEYTNT